MATLGDYGLSISDITDVSDVSHVPDQFSSEFTYTDPYGGGGGPLSFATVKSDGLMDYAIASPYLAFPNPGTGRQVWPYIINENLNRINQYLYDLTDAVNDTITDFNSRFDTEEANISSLVDSVNSYINDSYLTNLYENQAAIHRLRYDLDVFNDNFDNYKTEMDTVISNRDDAIDDNANRLSLLSKSMNDIYEWKDSQESEGSDFESDVLSFIHLINKNHNDIYYLYQELFDDHTENKSHVINKLQTLSYNMDEAYYRIESLESRMDIAETDIDNLEVTSSDHETRITTLETYRTNVLDDADVGIVPRVEATIRDISQMDATHILLDNVVGNDSIIDGEIADVKLVESYIKYDSTSGDFRSEDQSGTPHNLDMLSQSIENITVDSSLSTDQAVNEQFLIDNYLALSDTTNTRDTGSQVVSRDVNFDNNHIIDQYGSAGYSNKDAVPSIQNFYDYQHRNIADFVVTNEPGSSNDDRVFDTMSSAVIGITFLVDAAILGGMTTPVDYATIAVSGDSKFYLTNPGYALYDVATASLKLPARHTKIYSDQPTTLRLVYNVDDNNILINYLRQENASTSINLFRNPWSEKGIIELDNIYLDTTGMSEDVYEVTYDFETDLIAELQAIDPAINSGNITYEGFSSVLPYTTNQGGNINTEILYSFVVNYTTKSYIVLASIGDTGVSILNISEGTADGSAQFTSGDVLRAELVLDSSSFDGSNFTSGGYGRQVNFIYQTDGDYQIITYDGSISVKSVSTTNEVPSKDKSVSVFDVNLSTSGVKYMVESSSGTDVTIKAYDLNADSSTNYTLTTGLTAVDDTLTLGCSLYEDTTGPTYHIRLFAYDSSAVDTYIADYPVSAVDGSITNTATVVLSTSVSSYTYSVAGSIDHIISMGRSACVNDSGNRTLGGDTSLDVSFDYTIDGTIDLASGTQGAYSFTGESMILYGAEDQAGPVMVNGSSIYTYAIDVTTSAATATLKRITTIDGVYLYGDDISPILKNCHISLPLTNSIQTDNPYFVMENCYYETDEDQVDIAATTTFIMYGNQFNFTKAGLQTIDIDYGNSNSLVTDGIYRFTHSFRMDNNIMLDSILDDDDITAPDLNTRVEFEVTINNGASPRERITMIRNRFLNASVEFICNTNNSFVEIERNILNSLILNGGATPVPPSDSFIIEYNKVYSWEDPVV